MHREVTLSPVQQSAAEGLLGGIRVGGVMLLKSANSLGRTTILRHVCAAAGGAFVGLRDILKLIQSREPAGIEDAFLRVMEDALARNQLVVVDDLHLLNEAARYDYRWNTLLHMALAAILDDAVARGNNLVFATAGCVPPPVDRYTYTWEVPAFTAADYQCISRRYLQPALADRLDYAHIHRFAPAINAHQLRKACCWLAGHSNLDTDRFIDYLRKQNLTSNVEIGEVAQVDWNDLKGMDDVVSALEAKIALPLENDALAAELRLQPKRGVLLAGPPGTGKTTIGRALAHRLKGKFFLIDGTVVAGGGDFYEDVGKVFEEAKKNAPAIIFIDDTDVIFEGSDSSGFYRYLLTMLDGLESASAERVCVMMTAMNVSSLPAAMLRSGRVELWLETRLPDTPAREAILRDRLAPLPPPIGTADIGLLASVTRGLTGADLRAVVEDGKLVFAHDKAHGRPLRAVEEYFLEAVETVRANRRNYARRKPSPLRDEVRVGFTAV